MINDIEGINKMQNYTKTYKMINDEVYIGILGDIESNKDLIDSLKDQIGNLIEYDKYVADDIFAIIIIDPNIEDNKDSLITIIDQFNEYMRSSYDDIYIYIKERKDSVDKFLKYIMEIIKEYAEDHRVDTIKDVYYLDNKDNMINDIAKDIKDTIRTSCGNIYYL